MAFLELYLKCREPSAERRVDPVKHRVYQARQQKAEFIEQY
jgi:hypothetical protein